MAPEDKAFLVLVGIILVVYIWYRLSGGSSTPAPVKPQVRKPLQKPPVIAGARAASRPATRMREQYQHWAGMSVAQWIQNFGYPSSITNGQGCQMFAHRHPVSGIINTYVFRDGLLSDWTSPR